MDLHVFNALKRRRGKSLPSRIQRAVPRTDAAKHVASGVGAVAAVTAGSAVVSELRRRREAPKSRR